MSEPNVQSEQEALTAVWRELKAILVKAHPEDSAWEPSISHLASKIDAALASRPIPAQAGEREALPPLPDTEYVLATCENENERAYFTCDEGYSESQMREYARAALASRAAPVGVPADHQSQPEKSS